MRLCQNRSLSPLRSLRWVVLAAVLVVTLWACTSHPLTQPFPEPVQETDAQITIVPMRRLDLIFMIDNSPSMAPKQDKLKAQFPKLIDALRDPADTSLPDLRIAILDSDLGAGVSTNCGGKQNYGDKGQFQMRDPAACGVNANARWLEYTKSQPVNFTGDVSQVFGCVAGQLGTLGCGFEHQLGALEWAFFLDDNKSQLDFIRPEAYLGIVFLTDEDDCTAPPNTGMYTTNVRTESWSLRCATRGHECANTKLDFPITGPVSVPYASCHARMDSTCDASQVDTSVATTCNPLESIATLAGAVKQIKGGGSDADEKILVAAIYGTPRAGDTATPTYKIDKAPDPTPGVPDGSTVLDYWPICYDPAYPPQSSGYDKTAAEHGATGGLRFDAFLSEFPADSRLAYSICESDFGPAMAGIGKALFNKMGKLCVPFKLVDLSDAAGLQADCRVAYRKPSPVQNKDGTTSIEWKEDTGSLPMCDASRTPPCWEVKFGNASGTSEEKDIALRCPATPSAPSQTISVVRAPGDNLPDGTKVVMQCLTCVDPVPGVKPTQGCDY